MNNYWRFQKRENDVATEWSCCAETADGWQLRNPVGSGESGSFHAESGSGLRAFAKPAFQAGPNTPRAAHEKIAADLAFIAGIPVPPTVLWNKGATELFSLSLSAFRQPIIWSQALPMMSPAFKQNVSLVLSEGVAFHSWIGDIDHNNHGGNVVVDAECSEDSPAIAFIDHAFAMSYAWKTVTPDVVPISPYYFSGDFVFSPAEAAAAAKRIVAITDDQIKNIIQRIPVIYLLESAAMIVIETLIQRRASLARAFGV